jgi:hypothetical protein
VNALEVVRLVAGGDPAVAGALAAADRQAEALGRLADDIQQVEVRTAVIDHPRPRMAEPLAGPSSATNCRRSQWASSAKVMSAADPCQRTSLRRG